jgi:hypothetical protein
MKSFVELAQEWLAIVNPPQEMTEKILNRAPICDSCEKKEYDNEKKVNRCVECGCPLMGRIFSFNPTANCPLNKW